MRWFIKKFGLPLFMVLIGVVAMAVGILIMYYYENNILVYVAFLWCIIWAFINEGYMAQRRHREN